jgi:hypothetical protein
MFIDGTVLAAGGKTSSDKDQIRSFWTNEMKTAPVPEL